MAADRAGAAEPQCLELWVHEPILHHSHADVDLRAPVGGPEGLPAYHRRDRLVVAGRADSLRSARTRDRERPSPPPLRRSGLSTTWWTGTAARRVSPDGLIVHQDGVVVYVNPATLRSPPPGHHDGAAGAVDRRVVRVDDVGPMLERLAASTTTARSAARQRCASWPSTDRSPR